MWLRVPGGSPSRRRREMLRFQSDDGVQLSRGQTRVEPVVVEELAEPFRVEFLDRFLRRERHGDR